MHALKSKLVEVNSKGRGQQARRDLMAQMSGYHWRVLVERELQADDWTTLDVAEGAAALPLSDAPTGATFSEAEPMLVTANPNGNGYTAG
jgi:hypothetical protein